ncbi:hypothetical protein Ga0080574_TMP4460 [Salipiger abyssi]|uniref:Uncharacterized protein n=1 Tax=Salipiger abyssi TaxID=1250539 RepID=A0A1P8UZH4_9RHOB|nr:hypothetical protein Ga0080574_TMP4460 [Salipiger abyssi]
MSLLRCKRISCAAAFGKTKRAHPAPVSAICCRFGPLAPAQVYIRALPAIARPNLCWT